MLVVLVEGDLPVDALSADDGGLVGPRACHILDGVSPAAEDDEWYLEGLQELDAAGVPLEGEVELAEPVPREGVCARLQDDGAGLEGVHALAHHLLEEHLVAVVVDAGVEGHVDRVPLAAVQPLVHEVAGAGVEVPVLVEGDAHDAVRGVEGFLHPVPVVHVDVDVHDPLVVLEQLEDAQHDVVGVAEAGRLRPLRVVQAARPVDGHVAPPLVDLLRAADGAPRRESAEVVHPAEHRAVVVEVELPHLALDLLRLLLHRGHLLQEPYVVVRVEGRNILEGRLLRGQHLHLLVQSVVHYQLVRHLYSQRPHRVIC